MPDTPAATARRQSGWGRALSSPCPRRDCCKSTTANLPAASAALSALDSTIPAGYAFAIKGRTHGENCAVRGYPLRLLGLLRRLCGTAVDEPAVKKFSNLLSQLVASGALLC